MKKDKIIQIFDSENVSFKNINLLCSWGIDGSTGHSNYQQKFDEVNESMVTDSELLRKKRIQQKMYEEFGLRVDEPRLMGANSTTGN
uniref:Uncharacterized protein n=1 Tax=Anopheles quadriannulatus TaxID=34691 RepID=A0A182XPW3_ANOQN